MFVPFANDVMPKRDRREEHRVRTETLKEERDKDEEKKNALCPSCRERIDALRVWCTEMDKWMKESERSQDGK